MSKLNLDRDKIQDCRELAKKVTGRVLQDISGYTTSSIERASLRLLGIEDAYSGRPVVNRILDSLPVEERAKGVCYWFGRGLATQRTSPISLALRIAGGKIDLTKLPEASPEDIRKALDPLVRKGMERLRSSVKRKKEMEGRWANRTRPFKYVSVGTGHIEQDAEQAVTAARSGADCVALLRSSGQSLMDYIIHGETESGTEGTYATQANFRVVRQALDQASQDLGRYIRLVGNAAGLCMPEIALIGAVENVDYLLSDALYGILFRDINGRRAFADQQFARLILAHSGVIINTGEDNFLAHAESYRIFPQVLASQFLNEQFSFASRLQEWQMGFAHAFEVSPDMEDGFLYELAQAQMVRECFPKAPIKYMPPTRHKTGDIFFSHVMDGLFTIVGAMTHQDIQGLGNATEALHHPLLMNRYFSLKAANYLLKNTRSLGDEIQWLSNGKVVRRARSVLDGAHRTLEKVIKTGGLSQAIAKGVFVNVARHPEQGVGGDGVIKKDEAYFNPVWDALSGEAIEGVHIAPASHRRFSSYRTSGTSAREPREAKSDQSGRGASRSSSRGGSRRGRSAASSSGGRGRGRGRAASRGKSTRNEDNKEVNRQQSKAPRKEPVSEEKIATEKEAGFAAVPPPEPVERKSLPAPSTAKPDEAKGSEAAEREGPSVAKAQGSEDTESQS